MKFLGRLLSLLVTLVIAILPLAYADETIDYTKAIVDYPIPEHIIASSMDEFYGIWKLKYLSVYGLALDYELASGYTDYLIIHPQLAVFMTSGNFGVMTYNGLEDGALICTDGSENLQVFLNSDGTVSPNLSGTYIYCEKVSPDFEEVSFKALLRNPENYIGHFAHFTGTVVNVAGSRISSVSDSSSIYRINLAVDGDINNILFLQFSNVPDYNLLEGDNITVSVFLVGEHSYTNSYGGQSTTPIGFAFECTLNE